MFGCGVFGEAYFADSCFDTVAAPVRVGGTPLPARPRAQREEEFEPDEFALLLTLGYVD